MTPRWRLCFAVLFCAILAVGAGLGVSIMVDGYSPVPFADFWAQFPFIARGLDGDIGVGDLWAQWNEHRILLARLQFLLDYGVFGGTNVFLFASIAASCALVAAAFATAVCVDTRDWLLALGTLAVAGAATLSPAGIENLTWSFQVAFVQVFLFAVVAILAVVLAARATAARQTVATVAAAVAAGAATYSMANGLLAWVVVVGLAVALSLPRRLTIALALAAVVTVCSFLWRFEFSTGESLSDPVGVAHFLAIYLGSAAWGAGAAEAALVGAVGLALFGVLGALAWRDRGRALVALPFGAGVGVFVLLTAVQTAVGRLHLGPEQALASRYSIASFIFWLAIVVGLVVPLRERVRTSLAAPAALAGAGLVVLFVGVRTLPADSYLPTVVLGRELTAVAHRAGVDDVSQAVPGVQGGPGVREALRWLEREKLGPWVPGGMVDAQRVSAATGMAPRSCLGAIESTEPVTGGRRLRGWIASPDGAQSSRNLLVAGGGLGLVGEHRPDVASAGGSDWSGFVAYAGGERVGLLRVVLFDPEGRGAVCSLAG